MHDDSGLEGQATPKASFTFGSATGKVNPSNMFSQSSGGQNPFASFGSVAKDTAQVKQSSSQLAEAPKSPFIGFGQNEVESSKTPSNIFATSGAQTNGLSTSNIFGTSTPKSRPFSTLSQQKDNSSDLTSNSFKLLGSQPNNTPTNEALTMGKAGPSKPIFSIPASSTPAATSTSFETQSSVPSPSKPLFSFSAQKGTGISAPNEPVKPMFDFTKAHESSSASQKSPKKSASSQRASAEVGQTEEPQSSSSTKPTEPGQSPGPSKTSTLFSKLAQSQSTAPTDSNTSDTPKPKFTFGTPSSTPQSTSQGSNATSATFTPKGLQSAPMLSTKAASTFVETASTSPSKDSQASLNQTSNTGEGIFQRSDSPRKPTTNDQSQKIEDSHREKGKDTTKETTRPSFSLNTTRPSLEDPFTSPNIPTTTNQAPKMPITNIFARSAQPATTSTMSNTHLKTTKSSASSGSSAEPSASVQSAGPSQKIKFSSRGPSNIPGYLDNNTRAEVDIGHRLRSLNQGLVDHLKSLDPSTNDFGRAIEYYCDARQSLGKPLKFHQRASAGEKRKTPNDNDTENVDRAPKRRKSSGMQPVSQPSLKSAIDPFSSNQSDTATGAAGEASTVGYSPSRSTAEQLTPQPTFGQKTPQVFGRSQNSFGGIGETPSTTPFALKTLEPQPSPQHLAKPSSTSPLFGQSQTGTSAFGNILSSNSSTPKPSVEYTTPQSSFKPVNTSSFVGQPQANSSVFDEGAPSLKASRPNPIEERHGDRRDVSKDAADSFQSAKQTLSSSSSFSKPVEKRKVTELFDDDKNGTGMSQDDHGRSAKKSKTVTSTLPSKGTDDESGHDDKDSQEEGSADESSDAEEDASQDPTYEPEDEDDEREEEDSDGDGDENDLQKAMDDSRKTPVLENNNVGKSLFDRIEPNPSKQNEGSNATSHSATPAVEGAVKPSTSSLFGNKTGERSQRPSSTSNAAGASGQSSTSNLFSPKASATGQPSFTSSSGPVFGSSRKETFNAFGSSTFGQKWDPVESSTKSTTKGSPIGTPPLGASNGVLGSGLFGSRPATPDEEAKDRARPHGTSIFDNAPKFVGDQTFKEGTPIKFANPNAFAAPSVSVTAPSPKGKESENDSLPKSNGGLFGFNSDKSQPEIKPAQASLNVGFGFGNPPNLAPPSFPTSSVTSSANTSRATSPGATDTDSAADGVEEAGIDVQVNLMQSRPGEENDEILFDMPKARAFILDQGWKHRSYGPLRILKNNNTGKTRMLFRTDPGSQIIVNSFLVPGFEYKATPSGEHGGSIICIAPKEGGIVESWLFKLGSLESTEELAAVMEANKNN